MTDNEVAEVAKMQKRIDDLEACFENLFLNLRTDETCLMRKKDDTDECEEIWRFIDFVKTKYPEVIKEYHKSR